MTKSKLPLLSILFFISITSLSQKLIHRNGHLEAGHYKALQRELEEIFEEDQFIRRKFIGKAEKLGFDHPTVDSLGKIMHLKDSVNVRKVTKILDEQGWMGIDKVGFTANQTLFLVIQHADLKTQEKYLPIMEVAVKNGNSSAGDLAKLEDRVRLGQGKRQIYGSQIGRYPHANRYYVLPLEDPDQVDTRRSKIGLEVIANYVKSWGISWNVEEYKKELPSIEKLNSKR